MMTTEQRAQYLDLIPQPDPERIALVQHLGRLAVELDDEARRRPPVKGGWNEMVTGEIRRAAGLTRLAATLVMNGTLSEPIGSFIVRATRDYLTLIRRADMKGVIQ